MKIAVIHVVVFLSIFVQTVSSKNETWDVFVFVQQWPQSFCIKSRAEGKTCLIPRKINYWTIHGLWPSTFGHESPKHCSEVKFDKDLIKDLRYDMDLYWADYLNQTTLWAHEWSTHGTCAVEDKLTGNEKSYFQMGLTLRKKYDFKSMLDRCGILPSNGKTYQATTFTSCLKKYLGKEPDLHCYKKKADKYLLNEIRLCFTKDFQLEDCKFSQIHQPKYTKGNLRRCGSHRFVYPVMEHA